MKEIEKTYLAKFLPPDLGKAESKEIIDLYIPHSLPHPKIRIRKHDNEFAITKKVNIHGLNNALHEETSIKITGEEFAGLKEIPSRKIEKTRYYYPYKGRNIEIDVFNGSLQGLVLVDVEFSDPAELEVFEMPDFCLSDVTEEKAFAGGRLCGKSYDDLLPVLNGYGYKKIEE